MRIKRKVFVKTSEISHYDGARYREKHQSAQRLTHRQKAYQFQKERQENSGKGGEHWISYLNL